MAATVTIMGLASGCASVVSVTSTHYQSISVQTSEPGEGEVLGASCEINSKSGKWYVTTPGSVMIPRSNEDLQVICRKAELEKGSVRVVPAFRLAMFGNAAVGGVLGAAVDHVDGAAYAYPETISVVMGASSVIEVPDRLSALGSSAAPVASPAQAPQVAKGKDFQGSYTLHQSGEIVADSSNLALKRSKGIAVTNGPAAANFKKKRGDACDVYVGRGEYCWWSPPGNYNTCPTQLSLAACKTTYGNGCQLGHGKVVPSC
ncbi:MAG: hypothetical protein HY847_08530 [Betaproteobacteria bacterium]|nr:hypothetical protein [Betaproteobacteria bacterium]